jgi:hypothetical protein
MSRQQGLFPISGNFETRIAAPLDTRLVANTISNLTDIEYWKSGDNNVYLYKGIAVSVWNDDPDNNGIYILTNDVYTDIENWLKVSGSNQVGTIVNFEDTETIGFTQSGDTYSSLIRPDSITSSLLNTVEGFGATAGYLLSNDGLGNFKWLDPSVSDATITVEDYLTGQTFSGINNIIFRGGIVSTPTPPGPTATGVNVTGQSNTVTVWIPAPNYVRNFSPTLFSGVDRKVSNPTTNGYTSSIIPGNFEIGDWLPNSSQPSTNINNLQLFNDIEFSCIDEETTIDFILYKADGVTIIDQILDFNLNLSNVGTTQSNLSSLSITLNSFLSDADRFKSSVTGNINFSNVLPNGGRFSFKVIHRNGVDTFTFERKDRFFDSNTGSSTAEVNGNVTLTENVPQLNFLSGVAYYNLGSSFTASVFDMDNLNEISYPVGNQLNLNFNQMNISNVSIIAGGNGYIGWNSDWNVQDVNFIRSYSTTGNSNIPGLNSINELNENNLSRLTASVNDWTTNVISKQSINYKFMFRNTSSVTDRNTEDFNNETRRLKVSNLLSGNTLLFNSQNDSLSNNNLELQQIYGRLVYPKLDFTNWGPNYNNDNNINYSSLLSYSITIPVIDNLIDLTTQNISYNNYRWYARRFETPGAQSTMANGIFQFQTSFVEEDLSLRNDETIGQGNLLLYMAITNNSVPTKWYDLSKFSTSSPIPGPRSNATGAGSSNLDSTTKRIAWNTGSVSGWTCYLIVGIKNNSLNSSITQIDLTGGSWN